MKKFRIQVWPYLPASLAGAYLSALALGLAMVLGSGQSIVNGQPVAKLDYVLQHIGSLVRGVALLGTPFGLIAWPILSLCIPRDRCWRDVSLIFLMVIAWNVVMTPIDYQLPAILAWVGPFLTFAIGLLICVVLERRRPASAKQAHMAEAAQQLRAARTPKRIDVDVACAQCGYSLRELAIDARCPECGMRVEESLRQITWKPKARSFWLFLPISFGFAYSVALANLIATDLMLRFRGSFPQQEGLWGNKWLFFVLYLTVIYFSVTAFLAWPLFWVALRSKRLLPSLCFVFAVVTATTIASSDFEHVPVAPYVALIVALALCGWSGLFDRRPTPLGAPSGRPRKTDT